MSPRRPVLKAKGRNPNFIASRGSTSRRSAYKDSKAAVSAPVSLGLARSAVWSAHQRAGCRYSSGPLRTFLFCIERVVVEELEVVEGLERGNVEPDEF